MCALRSCVSWGVISPCVCTGDLDLVLADTVYGLRLYQNLAADCFQQCYGHGVCVNTNALLSTISVASASSTSLAGTCVCDKGFGGALFAHLIAHSHNAHL